MAKSAQTREQIVEAALQLFREEGYEATTMRRIAAQAGVSLGNAYYYFDGKDALVQELYRQIQAEHRARAKPLLADGAPLADNLRTVLHTGLDVMAPYHSFGATMLATALSPTTAVSPFSPQSSQPRAAATGLMELALRSSGTPSAAFKGQLPHLLWLAYLGVTVHWVTDTSPEQRRTHTLVDGLAPILAKAIALARLPVGRALATDVVALVEGITPHREEEA